ncbi:MAG: hypothetical protein ACOX8H_14395 [Ruminococcus sp.]
MCKNHGILEKQKLKQCMKEHEVMQEQFERLRYLNALELDANARGIRTKKPGKAGVLLSCGFIGFDMNLFWNTIYFKLHIADGSDGSHFDIYYSNRKKLIIYDKNV